MSSSSDEDDMDFMRDMYEIHQHFMNQEAESSSARNRRRSTPREHDDAHQRLMSDYFGPGKTKYSEKNFRRRFRMSKQLFLRILNDILSYDIQPIPAHFVYFRQRLNNAGTLGLTPHLKMTSAIRQLAYGSAPDALDEYLQMSERTSRESLNNFTKCIIDLYANVYLREPTFEDIQILYARHEELHGFPGMLGSIDCMHWAWAKCPNALRGQFTRGDHGHPTIMLEAVASYDLWIWHAYFGVAGANNDLNVLNSSPLFRSLLNDTAPQVPYVVNDVVYPRGYYLADGIYPTWASFVKGFSSPGDQKRIHFTNKQASARKDVERAFGVLQGRWHLLQQPARSYDINIIKCDMYACIIMHNMIIEDQGYNIAATRPFYVQPENRQATWHDRCETYLRRTRELRDRTVHEGLRSDLMEHLWRNRED